ncbi:MAG: hypothetical protein Q9160_001431 [Pyrenula sp. 1 TL-2023]
MASRSLTVAGTVPPTYWIDLDLPPRERYIALAKDYADHLRSLTGLFDDLVTDLHPKVSPNWFRRLARVSLRRLYTHEETEEIRGISETVGVDFYLVVALNVLLDMLMGCTSGAARCREEGDNESKMLHFRSLDWGMDPLRQVIVQLKFRRSKSSEPDKVLAVSITYCGFVGILTGVRQGLSVSLNFRPVHNATSRRGHFEYYSHLLLVLLGWRRSISSMLRELLLPASPTARPLTLADVADQIPSQRSTAAYLIFSDGTTTITMEKDAQSARLQSSDSFIVITNHDIEGAGSGHDRGTAQGLTTAVTGELHDFLDDSEERRECMSKHWQKKTKRFEKEKRQQQEKFSARGPPGTSDRITRSASTRLQASTADSADSILRQGQSSSGQGHRAFHEDVVCATEAELVEWLSKWPTTNETTHFAALLDPKQGRVAWVRMYLDPVPEPPYKI